ncbi:hypothetical protein Mal64_25710 [Pseudobythopirellula maris]|uniref:Segregation and condensation protein B n=1 Tax=Pseudobythopirellula maris TaxID=2527991 RepID=A0A5C5ZNQ1_9BACT|nr:hypothetical protein Mal64_25710 [Pseudobythopirellula maris]
MLLATEPLTLKKMAQLASLEDATEARALVDEIDALYAARGSAFRVERVAGGCRLLTRPALAAWIAKIAPDSTDRGGGADSNGASPLGRGPEAKSRADRGHGPTGAALETLSIVAYRQPVVRAEVEAIRGVGCGDLLRQLMEQDFLRIVGRSAELGRPLLYGTTKRFLELYGLRKLEDLPRSDELARRRQPTKVNEPVT